MARIRRFSAYRALERPYTRVSKFKEQSFVRAKPALRIGSFQSGNQKKKFQYTFHLKTKKDSQVRDNALESAKLTCNKLLEKTLGIANYFLKLKPYPHHVLRENPIAAGAGADRFSTGMKKSFGKPIGNAAQLHVGDSIFLVSVDKANLATAKTALERASKKLPCPCAIEVVENKA